jgi:hypothetical protein
MRGRRGAGDPGRRLSGRAPDGVLEHLSDDDAVLALREARRVVVPGGRITSVEGDYRSLELSPQIASMQATWSAVVKAMTTFGHSDAALCLAGWLEAAGFTDVEPGTRTGRADRPRHRQGSCHRLGGRDRHEGAKAHLELAVACASP